MKWVAIKGYEGKYLISEAGEVKSLLTNKVLAIRYNTKRYIQVALYKNGVPTEHMVHRLVAKHFVPEIPKKPSVNHKDLNKHNNHYTNLEWCTIPENVKHYFRNRTIHI